MRRQTVVWSSLAALCSLVLSMTACSNHREGDYVFLESRDAVMPVWTKGETESGTFVLHVHGGPGGSSIDRGVDGVFDRIEDVSGVTYWDQRGAGSSQGTISDESLTIEQYADDLDKTISLLRARHDIDSLFLMSHDFGVNVVAEYLQDQQHQQAIDGWIFVAGNYDVPMSIGLSRDWITAFADNQIEAGNDIDKWEEIRDWYTEHPRIDTGDEYRQHREHIDEADGLEKENRFERDNADRIFMSPEGGFAPPVNRSRTQNTYWDREGSLETRVTQQLTNIAVPTLVVWGADDGLTPLPMADNALETLGTADSDKQRFILRESAHRPELDQNTRFQRQVNQFIESYQ